MAHHCDKKPREGMDIEFLDRLNTVLMLMDDLLIDHDSAVFYGVNDKINEASDILAQVYQDVGCKVVEDDKPSDMPDEFYYNQM